MVVVMVSVDVRYDIIRSCKDRNMHDACIIHIHLTKLTTALHYTTCMQASIGITVAVRLTKY